MRVFTRVLRWTLFTLLFLIGVGLGIAWIVDFRQSDNDLREEFKTERIKPTIHYYSMGDRTIRFMETPADSTKPTIIFVHGAPSSLSFFNKFFHDSTLVNRAQLVSVDRPGYGYSDFGRVETSVIRQAELLQPLIDRYRNAPFLMIVGSSYGGSVSARLAMNNSGVVDHVVFVSSALGPGLERTYGISYWIDRPPLRWLVPPLLRLANDEKLAHRKALAAILPDWHHITAGITMLHGQRDDLVFPTNVSFARHQLIHAQVKQFILPENRHDIVFNKRQYMTDIILEVLNQQALPHDRIVREGKVTKEVNM